MRKISLIMALTVLVTLLSCGDNGDNDKNQRLSIVGKEVSYSTDSLTMKGYLSYNEFNIGKVPGVLVVHEWWGHNDYARLRADMLAEMGYVALAVDMYGDGKQAQHPDEAGKFAMAALKNLDDGKARFEAAMNELKSHPRVDPDKIAAIGYCFGGSVVLEMAILGEDLDGIASFHGGLKTKTALENPGQFKGSILICMGGDDQFITEEQVTELRASLDKTGSDYKFVSYPGAKHSFTNPHADDYAKKFDLPVGYNKEADEKSWAELKVFLKKIFQ